MVLISVIVIVAFLLALNPEDLRKFVFWTIACILIIFTISALYNTNCLAYFAKAVGYSCSINYDYTEIKCKKEVFEDKELSLTIKINKCEEPVTIDITVKALDFSWQKTFQSSQTVAIPGLSIKLFRHIASARLYLQVNLKDTGSTLQLKILTLTGFKILGKFKETIKDTIVDRHLPIRTYECGIVRWWKSLGDLQYAVIAGAIALVILLLLSCYCCFL